MIFVDTNVIIDVLARDPVWFSWSADRLSAADPAVTSTVVLAELAKNALSCGALLRTLNELSVEVLSLDPEAAFGAGIVFGRYRTARGSAEPKQVLADFFIGGHALACGAALLTRDTTLYRRYFPDLTLITPETHP